MSYVHENRRIGSSRIFLLAILLLIMLTPMVVEAAQYYVWGRVYSAYTLAEGDTEPNNPLNPLASGHHKIGDKLVAQETRNMVRVRVVEVSSGNELGSQVVLHSGNYFISFTNAAAAIDVKFIVEELSTSKKLLESMDPTPLSPWTANNIYHLLVPENINEIGDSRTFATCTCPFPALYTGIFTRVGKIELATSLSGAPTELISTTTGRATVPNAIATQLHIPAYTDSPFGGNLYLFGAFSQGLYGMSHAYYRIRIDTPGASPQYIKDPLVKTKYSINMMALPLTVQTDRIALGPFYYGDIPYYKLTPMAGVAGPVQFFWSFPDLLALWSTGSRNGQHTLTLEAFIIDPATLSTTPVAHIEPPPPGIEHFCATPHFTDLKLFLDNVAPVADIMAIDTAAGAPHTPYIYTPADPATITGTHYDDLQGDIANYGPTTNPICSILEFTQPSQRLAFKLTAYHASGYMRYWKMSFKRNNTGYSNIIGKQYSGGVMQDYAPLVISPWPESTLNGFQSKFLYLTPAHLNLGSPDGCGYRFFIEAGTRTTDGYYYLHWDCDEDIHYIKQ